ncbi:MAG: methyltransferase domain-containing protein [Syntrophomonadaceae bacterium]|nr:methyltransferase domain-containing protein [Syntrophomonadaceae bacterium]
MKIENLKSLICTNNHCLDISRYGYVNMLLKPAKIKYNKEMFASRRIICNSGFFDPLIEQISHLIIAKAGPENNLIKILDAGCGEGHHLASIREKIKLNNPYNIVAVGLDISKEAVLIGAKEYKENIWCVADLANCPFADGQFDFILNILSPSNYVEFQRLLADDGLVIKVIPNSNYLQELRKVYYEKTEKENYSNDETKELFEKNLKLLDIKHVNYNVPIDNENLKHLINMTPLSWGTSEETIEKVLDSSSINNITVDLTILIGEMKRG